MAITLVNHGAFTGSGPLTWTPVVGNVLVLVSVTFSPLTAQSITDSVGNTWTSGQFVANGTSSGLQMFYAPVTATGSSISINSGGHIAYFVAAEFSGVQAVVDNSTHSTGTGTTESTGSYTTTNAVDLIIAGFTNPTASAWSGLTTGYTLLNTTAAPSYVAYLITSASGTQSASVTNTSATWAGLSVALNGSATFSYTGGGSVSTSGTATTSANFISHVQSTSVGFAGSGSRSLAYTSNNTAGNFLVAVMSGGGTTCTDTAGNTWASSIMGIWYCSSCVGGANTVTISGGSGVQAMTIGEFTGVSAVDVGGSGSGSGGSATWTSNAITTTHANELLIAQVSNGFDSLGINSPFTTLGTNESYFVVGYEIVNTIQTGVTCSGANGNGNVSNTWGYGLGSFYSVLNPPSGVTGVAGNTSATLNWTAPATGSLTYSVYRSSTGSGGAYSLVGTVLSPTVTFTDTGLTNGATYWYELQAANTSQTSGFSTPIAVTIPPPVLTGTAGSNSAALSWTQPSGATTYTLSRSTTGSGGTYSTLYTGSGSSFTDTTPTYGSSYWYEVNATGGSFTNTLSNTVNVLPLAVVPTISYVQSNSKGFTGANTCAFTSNNTAGNFLVAAVAAVSTTCSDTQGNTWVQTASGLWFCPSCKAGANTVTLNGTSGSAVTIGEFTGLNSHDVGAAFSGSGGSSTYTTNAVTTTHVNELLVSSVSNGFGSLGVNSPFTTLGIGEGFFIMGYLIVSSVQTGTTCTGSNGNGNVANTWAGQLDSFYYSTAGGGARTLTTLGIGT